MMRSGISLQLLSVHLLFAAVLAGALGPVTALAAQGAALESQKVPVEGGGSYTDVSADGLAVMLNRKDFPLINVHVPYDGEIEGTDLFVPFDQVETNLRKLPTNKRAELVVYCRSGSMSAIAARALVKLGYTDVWNLDGGMIAWKKAGYSIARRGQ